MANRRGEELTDEQWAIIGPLIPEPPRRDDGRGRPWKKTREVMNGVLWILRSGARWQDLPERFPPYQTFAHVARLTSQNALLMGRSSSRKKGRRVGKTKRGKGTKPMAMADSSGLLLSVYTESASLHEVTLVRETLLQGFTAERPERLIGDKAYDSDPLDAELAEAGIEMIAPHKSNRKKAPTQDGRVLRCYKRRWKVEVCFRGCKSSAGLRLASTFTRRIISASFILVASRFCSDAIYETVSSRSRTQGYAQLLHCVFNGPHSDANYERAL